MEKLDFNETLDQVVKRDPRYHREAYHFLREALDHTQQMLGHTPKQSEIRHVSGQQLLEGIRDYALKTFGPMARTVLEEWGVRRCEDFGEIVFNLLDHRLLSKTDRDRREDFKGGYDFDTAFRLPFLPAQQRTATPPAATPKNAQG